VIETQRLILRGWRDEDRAPFWALAQDPEVMRYLGTLTRQEADASIDRMMAMQDEHGHCFWALEARDDGRFLGFCGIVPPREPTFEYEVGWRIARERWGVGLAREAAQATLAWAWANLATDTVVAITVRGNERSWRLMERLGMQRDLGADFDHPRLPEGDPLRPHILYRISRPHEARPTPP